ncbi:MAG: hypothetical protein KDA88_05370 [Planctomycetaceae bacterium]|nr:hypothetical protein [Planctomycetaceae bacterium]MCB9949729.1 hypothetical protein [Planctomycetaceae bacterium]
MGGQLQFLQVGALRLNEPLFGLSDVPSEMQQQLACARYQTATQIVDAALREHVELVAFVGSTTGISVQGSRAPWFLWEQFQRLNQHGIHVAVRSQHLPHPPAGLTWPANVHLVSPRFPASIRVRSGHTVRVSDECDITNALGAAAHDIVLSQHVPASQLLEKHSNSYWACGGPNRIVDNATGNSQFLAAGVPQGDEFSHAGPCGSLLVSLKNGRALTSRLIPCSSVVWHSEQLELTDQTTIENVRRTMTARHSQLACSNGLQVVRWEIAVDSLEQMPVAVMAHGGAFLRELRNAAPANVWIEMVRLNCSDISASEATFSDRAIAVARNVMNEMAASATIDFARQTSLADTEIPSGLQTVTKNDFLNRIQTPLDARLVEELSVRRTA